MSSFLVKSAQTSARIGRVFLASILVLSFLNGLSVVRGAERVKMIDDWKFRRGDADEPSWRLTWRNLEPFALATQGELFAPNARPKKAWGTPGFQVKTIRPEFDDSDWEIVDLPHDAAISEPFSYANEPTQSLLPDSQVLWYRKTFDLPSSDAGKTIALDFDGVMSRSSVWVNGSYVGGWGYGYSSFRVDATPYVKFGGSNVVVVRCANPPQSSRWYTGNGIYRNVWLVKSHKIRVARWGVFVQTPRVSEEEAALDVTVEVENADVKGEAVEALVSVAIYRRDADGNKIGDAIARLPEKSVSVKPGERVAAQFDEFALTNPPIWAPETPNTCFAETTISVAGQAVDVEETAFGFRQIEYKPDEGLFVNGKLYELRGFCLHHDFGALGAAYNAQAEKRRLLKLKEIGCNAIRLSHNPSAPETVDQLARLGFLVQAEAFDQWRRPQNGSWRAAGYLDLFDKWSEADIRSLVRRDRNCPAIIMWSIGNEIPELVEQSEFVVQAKRLVEFVRQEDPTRPTTSACNQAAAGFGEIPSVLDVFGYNYYGRRAYAEFHKKNPNSPVYGSEVVCTGASRGWYVFPVSKSSGKLSDGMTDFHQSSYSWFAFGFNHDKPLDGWACPPDYEFEAQDRNPFVCGAFAWTGVDYLGAPFTIDELSRSQVFTDPEVEKKALEEKELYGSWRCPLRICETGAFDSALFPKDLAYLYKSRWLPDEKTTWILPHWNFPERVGEVTPVYVFTSGDSAELFLNGKSLGRKTKGEFQYRLTWDDVRYEPGELRVVSYKNGEIWDESKVETTGAPVALRLNAERSELTADGRDLAFVTLEVVDAQGRVVPNAQIDVTFQAEGAGTLVATDSGNACDLVSYVSPTRRTFAGLTSAIMRSNRGESGKLTLKANAEGLKGASVDFEVR